MKVIEHGMFYKKEYKKECKVCHCIFELSIDELRVEAQYVGVNTNLLTFYYFCPECRVRNILFKKKVLIDNSGERE